MRGASLVVAWEDGVEACVAGIYAQVDVCGIAVPYVDVEAAEWLTGVCVDVLDVEVEVDEVDAGLTFTLENVRRVRRGRSRVGGLSRGREYRRCLRRR